MKALRKLTITAGASGLTALFALQVNAGNTTEVIADSIRTPTEIAVNYADLDLTSAAGQEALQYRLARAAEQVCGHSDVRRAGGVAQAARNEECYEQSLSDALSKANYSAVASTGS